MIRRKIWVVSMIFVGIDAIIIFSVFRLATVFRRILAPVLYREPVAWEAVVLVALLGIALTIGMFFLQGLYPGYGLSSAKELKLMGKAITMAFIMLTSISYLNKAYQEFPRSIMPIAWAFSLIILPVTRFITRNLLARTDLYGIPVVVFGQGDWALEVMKSLKRVRRLGWKPHNHQPLKVIELNHHENLNFIAILATTTEAPIMGLVRILSQHYKKVVLVQKTDNFGSLWVVTRDLDSILGLEFQYHLLAQHNRWLKRTFDFFGAAILITLLSPLLILLSVLIAISSPGPVFYRQTRIGKGFKHFGVLKFRTMVLGAEGKLQGILQKDPRAKTEYAIYHKLKNDPRVTQIGRILRKFSLDELPQLWNVLKGEMSLSGPRAYLPVELNRMDSYAATILRVNPGMTGWWQVLGRHQTSFQRRLEMDEYYISNWSLWLDAYILLRTVLVVIKGEGS